MNFTTQLAKYRQKNHLTQTQLAKLLQVTPSTVSNWESGKREPKLKMLPQLARTLNITIMQLLFDDDMIIPEPSLKG